MIGIINLSSFRKEENNDFIRNYIGVNYAPVIIYSATFHEREDWMLKSKMEQEKEIRKELDTLYEEFGYLYKDYCTKEQQEELSNLKKEGQPLPDNLCYDAKCEKLYYSIPSSLSAEELEDLTKLRLLKYTRNISYAVNFIVLVIVLGILLSILNTFR